MKLVLTALIDFNNHQKFYQNSTTDSVNVNNGPLSLIDPQTLFANLSEGGINPKIDIKKYQKELMPATLRFTNFNFRHQYLHWIYTSYSDSVTNQYRIRQSERTILIKWAHQFNHHHHYLKIMTIRPNVNNSDLMANLTIIGFSWPFGKLSFDFRGALEAEYNEDYDNAFNHLEASEGHRITEILETILMQYIPDANFQFINKRLSIKTVSDLKPMKFNQEWISKQQKKSEASSAAKNIQLQKMCNSVLSSANSCSVADINLITSLHQQLRSITNERASLINVKRSQANLMESVHSNLVSVSQSAFNANQSLTTQLLSVQSYANYYTSLASINASKYKKASKQSTLLSSTCSMYKNSLANNYSLSEQVNSLKANSLSTNQSIKSLNASFSSINRVTNSTNAFKLIRANRQLKSLSSTNVSHNKLLTKNHSLLSQIKSLKNTSILASHSAINVTRSLKVAFWSSNQSKVSVNKNLKASLSRMSNSLTRVKNTMKLQSFSALNLSRSTSPSNADVKIASISMPTSSVKYASDYDFSSLNENSISNNMVNSLSFGGLATINHSFRWRNIKDPRLNSLITSKPRVRWNVIHKRSYIPLIIAISIVILIILILIFPILKF